MYWISFETDYTLYVFNIDNVIFENINFEFCLKIKFYLVNVYDETKIGMNNGLSTILVLFDFTQAFPSTVLEILF